MNYLCQRALFFCCLSTLWFNASEAEIIKASTQEPGRIVLEASDPELSEAFDWAKKQALAYAFSECFSKTYILKTTIVVALLDSFVGSL